MKLSRFLRLESIAVALFLLAGTLTPLCAISPASNFGAEYNVRYLSGNNVQLFGRLHVPTGYDPVLNPNKRYPLIVFMHGAGEVLGDEMAATGTCNTWQVNGNIDNLFNNVKDKAFIYAPQCNSNWDDGVMKNLMTGIAKMLGEYEIAPDQIYVTGLSLGGGGTWIAMINFPIFAAGVPVCGTGPVYYGGTTSNLVNVPIWAFHNDPGKTVLSKTTRTEINAIRAAETPSEPAVQFPVSTTGVYTDGTRFFQDEGFPDLRYSEYLAAAHNEWFRVYADNEPAPNKGMMYAWLFSKRKTIIPLQPKETILFDFGKYAPPGDDLEGRSPDSQGRMWNSTGNTAGTAYGPEKTLGMPIRPAFTRTSAGRQTFIGIKITSVFSGCVALGGTDGMLYDADIARDGYSTLSGSTAAMTIYGLNPGTSYRLAIYATGTDNDGTHTRVTCYQVGDTSVELDPFNNVSKQVFLTGSADADGTLTLQVMPKPGTAARYGLISALEISLESSLLTWRQLHGLPGDGSQDFAIPAGDGVANLVKYALNLAPQSGDLAVPAARPMPLSGTAGLPRTDLNSQGQLVFTFVRRKAETNPEVIYTVEQCNDLTGWLPCTATPMVEALDATWERVSYSVNASSGPRSFLRLKVERP